MCEHGAVYAYAGWPLIQALGWRTTHARQLIARSAPQAQGAHLAQAASTSQDEPPRVQRRDKLESARGPLIRRRAAGRQRRVGMAVVGAPSPPRAARRAGQSQVASARCGGRAPAGSGA